MLKPAMRSGRIDGVVFVGMSFVADNSMRVFQVIHEECARLGLKATRADLIAGSNHVHEDYSRLIRSAAFCIFDVSGNRGSVHHEVGLAEGCVANERVLLLASKGTDLAFNIRSRRVQFYDSMQMLRAKVRAGLLAMMTQQVTGHSAPHDEPPASLLFPGVTRSPARTVSIHGDGNVVAGRDVHLQIKTTRRSQQPAVLPGTVATQPMMKNYLDYLIGRYNEFKAWDCEQNGQEMSFAQIRVAYRSELGSTVNNTPVDRFEAAVDYLQKRISRTTLGRMKGKSGPLFSSFQDFESQPKTIRRKLRQAASKSAAISSD